MEFLWPSLGILEFTRHPFCHTLGVEAVLSRLKRNGWHSVGGLPNSHFKKSMQAGHVAAILEK